MELKGLIKTQKEIEKLAEIQSKNDNDKDIKIVLQKNNIAFVLFNEIKDKICEIWNKYIGKQYGEKTSEKIKNEIENAFDNDIFIHIHADSMNIYLQNKETKCISYIIDKLEINARDYNKPFLVNNQIQKMQADNFYISIKQYIDNIDETIEKFRQMHKQALKMQDELHGLCDIFNNLSGYKINPIKYEFVVKHYLK